MNSDKNRKPSLKKAIEILITALAGVSMAIAGYWVVDNIWNGALADWFISRFITYEDLTGTGTVQIFNWVQFRSAAFWILCFTGLFFALALWLFFFLGARWKKKRDLEKISRLLSNSKAENEDPDYEPLIRQLEELKNEIDYKAEKLELEARRKEDLITYLAHDLKTPLTSIIGYLNLLQEKEGLSVSLREKYTGICLEKAYRTQELLEEFFDITRFNLNKMSLEKEEVDVAYLLVQMKEEFYPLLKKHGNSLELDLKPALIIEADRDKLARVFNNILKNAIAYSYESSPILITARQEEKTLSLIFENQGKTIPSQKLEALFEKFFRLDEARSSHSGGAGLGLAIAKEIIALHKGTIQAQSENETTRFIITLPIQSS